MQSSSRATINIGGKEVSVPLKDVLHYATFIATVSYNDDRCALKKTYKTTLECYSSYS